MMTNLNLRTPTTTATATATTKKTTMKTTNTTMNNTNTTMKKRNVRLNNTITISEIPHNCTYTEYERLSAWYTDDDYLLFKLDHEYRCLRYDKEQRSTCIKAIQYLMLQAQYNERIYIINSDPRAKKFDLFKQWLSEFYIIHSKQCIIAGQQRALENYRVVEMKSPTLSPKGTPSNPSPSPLLLSSSLFLLEPIYRDRDCAVTTTTTTTNHTFTIDNSEKAVNTPPIIPNNTPGNTNVNNSLNITSRILETAQSLMVDGGIGDDSNSNSNSSRCKRLSAAIESCPSSTTVENTIMPIKRNGKKQRRNSFVCIF